MVDNDLNKIVKLIPTYEYVGILWLGLQPMFLKMCHTIP